MSSTPEQNLRYSPPRVRLPASLSWVIRRALGPAGAAAGGDVEAGAALGLARELKLASRIRRRTAGALLEQELGPAEAEAFEQEQRLVIAGQMAYEASCLMIAKEAQALGTQAVFIKGLALRLLGLIHAEDRPVVDVDVLVPERDCRRLWDALRARGMEQIERFDIEHHLAALSHPRWRKVDIHHLAAGVEVVPGKTTATVEQLLENELVVAIPGFPENASVPRVDLTLGHLTVHALVHHSELPSHFFRFLADVQTLAEWQEDGYAVLRRAHRWIRPFVTSEEIGGIENLLRCLAAGADPGELANSDQPGAPMLRHFLAVVVDQDYVKSLMLTTRFKTKSALDFSHHVKRHTRLWWSRKDLRERKELSLSWGGHVSWNLKRYGEIMVRFPQLVLARFKVTLRSRQSRSS